MEAISLLTVTLILCMSLNASGVVGQINTVIYTGEGVYPLWWALHGYGWVFIKLAYIFAGLLALFVYKNVQSDPEPAYGSYSNYKTVGRSNDVNLEEQIRSYGLKYK